MKRINKIVSLLLVLFYKFDSTCSKFISILIKIFLNYIIVLHKFLSRSFVSNCLKPKNLQKIFETVEISVFIDNPKTKNSRKPQFIIILLEKISSVLFIRQFQRCSNLALNLRYLSI